jgi:hypothetical protein
MHVIPISLELNRLLQKLNAAQKIKSSKKRRKKTPVNSQSPALCRRHSRIFKMERQSNASREQASKPEESKTLAVKKNRIMRGGGRD